jgi:hypothetical protein
MFPATVWRKLYFSIKIYVKKKHFARSYQESVFCSSIPSLQLPDIILRKKFPLWQFNQMDEIFLEKQENDEWC